MTLCEREQDDRLFKKVKQLTIDGPAQNVHHMTLSPAEDMLIASMDNNQMYSLNLTTNEEVSTQICTIFPLMLHSLVDTLYNRTMNVV